MAQQGALRGAPLHGSLLAVKKCWICDLVTASIFSCCGHLSGDINAILGD